MLTQQHNWFLHTKASELSVFSPPERFEMFFQLFLGGRTLQNRHNPCDLREMKKVPLTQTLHHSPPNYTTSALITAPPTILPQHSSQPSQLYYLSTHHSPPNYTTSALITALPTILPQHSSQPSQLYYLSTHHSPPNYVGWS